MGSIGFRDGVELRHGDKGRGRFWNNSWVSGTGDFMAHIPGDTKYCRRHRFRAEQREEMEVRRKKGSDAFSLRHVELEVP